MNIAILYGQVPERPTKDDADTLAQCEAISQVLSELGHSAFTVPLSLDAQAAQSELCFMKPDLVFNLVESIEGEGRLIHLGPALLDTLGISYTGAGADAVFLTSNKTLAKRFLKLAGLPTPEWFSARELKNGAALTQDRYIVKSVWEHASIGLSEESVIATEQVGELLAHLLRRQSLLGSEAFAEAYIEGREFNVSLLAGDDGPEVLPPAEILFDAYPKDKLQIVDYRAKWEEESFEYTHTPRNFYFRDEDEPLLEGLKDLSRSCWNFFGLKGYARVDFRVDRQGSPWILEVNANPCLSPDAGFVAAARQGGIQFNEVIGRILQEL